MSTLARVLAALCTLAVILSSSASFAQRIVVRRRPVVVVDRRPAVVVDRRPVVVVDRRPRVVIDRRPRVVVVR